MPKAKTRPKVKTEPKAKSEPRPRRTVGKPKEEPSQRIVNNEDGSKRQRVEEVDEDECSDEELDTLFVGHV